MDGEQRLSVRNRVLRHDIRTQAQLLYGYTDRLESGEIASARATEEIQAITDQPVELSEDAQQLQRLFDGVEMETKTLDIVPVVRDAGAAVEASHEQLDVDYDLPSEQAVHGPLMLGDAVEHAETAEPRASVSIAGGDEWVRLTVADNGPGIPSIELIHTTEESESQLHHSKGIGLWLVTWIVEEGGGRMDIETDPDGDFGTVVSVLLRPA